MEKTYVLKDQKTVTDVTLRYLQEICKNPNKMPICMLCKIDHSYMLVIHQVEGESRTMILGLCQKCWPKENGEELTPEIQEKLLEAVKKQLEDGDHILHLTPKEWIQ